MFRFRLRNVIELRCPLGSIPVEEIKLNAKSRDDTPALLIGLQANPELLGRSFDQNFHSPSNRKTLDDLLEVNALPKKGGRSSAEREVELAFAALANAPGNPIACILGPSSLWNLYWKQLERPAAQASRRSRKND